MTIQPLFVPLTLVLLLNLCYFEGISGYGEYHVTITDKCQGHTFTGSLVADYLVTVAASSVAHLVHNPTALVLKAGVTSDKTNHTVQTRESAGIYITFPELFRQNEHAFDIAKVIVNPPFKLNHYVKIIPISCHFTTGDITSIVRDSRTPNKFDQVKLTEIPDTVCLAKYGGTNETASCGMELDGYKFAFKTSDIGTATVVAGRLGGIIIRVPNKNEPNPRKSPIQGTDLWKVCGLLSPSQQYKLINMF